LRHLRHSEATQQHCLIGSLSADDIYTEPLGNYLYMTLHQLPRRCGGSSSRAHHRNREANQAEPVTNAAPPATIIDIRITVTVGVVPMAQSKATGMERSFTPMYAQMVASLPEPNV
jgi:hypothetical protein